MQRLKKSFFRRTGQAFAGASRMLLNHEMPRDAAGISYFALLSLIPAILVLIALVDAFLGWMDLHRTVVQQIIALFPGSRQFLRANLDDLTNPSTPVVLSCVVVVLWSFSWIFTFIEGSINRAWGTPNQRTFLESRLRSVALLVLGAICLLTSAATTALVSAMQARTAARIPTSAKANYIMGWFWYLILLGAGLLIAMIVFALIYKLTPHCKVLWREAFSGALVSTVLWEIGSIIFVKLLPFFNYQKTYGRMGAIIALMGWVYTSDLIMLFGANFSAQLNRSSMEKTVQEPGGQLEDKIRSFPSYRI
jgi:membrane protein